MAGETRVDTGRFDDWTGAWDPATPRDPDELATDMGRHLDALRASGSPGAVHLPGDVAAAETERRLAEGIPLGQVLLGQLRDLSARLGLEDRLD